MYKIRISISFVLLALTALSLIPLTILRPFHRNNMGDVSTILTKIMAVYWGVNYQFENEQRLTPDRSSIIILNHQDTHDMFFAESAIRRGTVSLGKWEVIYIPFVGLLFFLGGNIMIKRANKQKSKKALSIAAKKIIDNNLSLLIFPEGTRNWGKPLPFKLGAFKLAIEAGVPIQPVCFSLRDKSMNYFKYRSGTIKVKCLEPISTEGLTLDDALDLAIRCRKLMEAECISITKTLPLYREEGYAPLNGQ
jgi:1-acyl-sn-glycerol-3-phosphate acyltransferase